MTKAQAQAQAQAPKRSVYLHCRGVFTGANARVRKTKSVRKLLEKNKHSFGVLTNKYDLGTICNVAKELLNAGIFESMSTAQAQFPELFQSSDGTWQESESSDFEATQSEAEAMETKISSGEENTKTPDVPHPKFSPCGSHTMNSPPATPITPTLDPIYLPHKTQHRLLTMIQSILEECCFNFGRLWLPEVLKARSCECFESIELTRWTRILFRHCKDLPSCATTEAPGVSFRDVLFKTHQIRHAAVHRRPASVSEIEEMMGTAVSLTMVLKDALRTRKLETIQREVETTLEELKRGQNDLKLRMLQELAMIGHRRKLLDELEKKAIDTAFSESHDNRSCLGSRLDRFLITSQRRTDLNTHHPGEFSCAERKDTTTKLEDIEATSSPVAGRFIAG